LETRIAYDPVTLRPLNVKTFYQNAQVGTTSETIYHDEPNNYWVKSRTQIDTNNWAESISYFDGLGRAYKAEEVDSKGNIFVEKEFDAQGRTRRVTNPFRANEAKIWTTNVYDEASRVKEVVLPDGAKVKTDYGVSVAGLIGITKQITDQAGKKRKGISDALGRMIRVIEDPDGQNLATDYVFDTLGNLRKTIQGEQSRYFTHDSLGRLLYAKQPEQEANTAFVLTDSITNNSQWSVKYEYDDNGNITKTTDARGVYVQGTYDNFNRLKTRDYSDSTPDVSFFYDGRGLPSIPNFSKGKTTKVSSSISESRYNSFDNQGRLLTSEQRTPFSDTETIATAAPRVSSYNYDAFGKLLTETYPSGRTVKMDYDQDGDVASVWGTVGTQNRLYANGMSYNSAGAIERLRLGNGKWETTAYNDRLQVTQIGLGSSATDKSLLKLEYDYGTNTQNNGSMRSQKISFNGLSQPFEQNYQYDDLNRLLSAEEKVGTTQTWKQTFSYDRYGNRRFDAANTTTIAASNNVTNPTIDTATNRFSANQGYNYDKDGNVTLDAENKRFVYDAENHQTKFFLGTNNTQTPDGVYAYDGEGKRVKKISSTETTIFVYDGGGQLVAEYSTQISQTPQVSYLTSDHLGSPRIITDGLGKVIARHDYSAFGDETATVQRTDTLGYKNDSIRQDYTGYQKDDESGLEYAQARYYNSAHGRFTSVDPLTASANTKNPQTFNRYSYVLNSPYKFSDPLGLLPYSKGSGSSLIDGVLDGFSRNYKKDLELLQWHVANGTALGYAFINAIQNRQSANSSASGSSGTPGRPNGSSASPPAPTAEQNADDPPAINAVFDIGSVFPSEVPKGNELPPSRVSNDTVTESYIERRYNISATMGLKDSQGNEFKDYEYEVSYDDSINPDPKFNRVEGKQSTNNGEAFLGTFIAKSIKLGKDQSNYKYDNGIPDNTDFRSGATVTIYAPDGRTAKIKFEVTVKGTAAPIITPESTQVKWIKPSK
jgi:RHS repeat-associated protein